MRGQKRVEDARERAEARASIFFARTFCPAMTTWTSAASAGTTRES